MFTRKNFTLSNQIKISYLEWNQGQKPLILLHGLADHGLVWSSLGEYLAKDYHIIAPDLRGHGDSSKPKMGYSSLEIIDDLEKLMTHLGWESADILGHSWTGKLITIWATKSPERFKKIILVDPFFINKIPNIFKIVFPLLYGTLPFLKGMGPFKNHEKAQQIAKELKQYKGWSKLQEEVFNFSIEEKENTTWGSKFVVEARNEIFTDVMLIAGLTKIIENQTLFIKPKQGLNRTKWQLKPFKTYLKNLEVAEVAGNHWTFLVEPEIFNQTVEKFLNK